MSTRHLLSLTILSFLPTGVFAQTSALEVIPADAAIAIVIRNPDELRKKGDTFLEETKIDLGIRPTDALNMVTNFLGINQGLDLKRPAGAVLLRPKNAPQNIGLEDLDQSLYVMLPFTDLDKMAGNFGFQPGQLKLDVVTKANKPPQFGQFVLAREKTLYLANTEASLERLRKAKSLAGELTPEQRQAFGKADVVFHVKPENLGPDWSGIAKIVAEELGRVDDPKEKESIGQFVKALDHVRFALAGFRVEDGLGINMLTVFSEEKNDAVKAFLASLSTKSGAHIKGLPEGRVIAAQAYAGDGAKNAVFARALVNFLLKAFLENRQLTSATDRPTFLGIFSEVWQRLEGSRIGVYLTGDEAKRGLFSLIAILDAEDAAKFLADMRTLAKIADGTLDMTKKDVDPELNIGQWIKDLSSEVYKVRASANTRLRLVGEPALPQLEKTLASPPDLETSRRAQLLIQEIRAVAAERRKELLAKDLPRYVRPTFAFVARAETRAGLPVDIVHIKLKDQDKLAAGQMKQFFGPDWDKLRLAVHGNQVVVLLGSEVELFDAALGNLKNGSAGLANSKLMAGLARSDSKKATAAFYVSVDAMLDLVQPQARRPVPRRLTSFALAVEGTALQLDLFVPIEDIKVIEKEIRR